jgi:hypothetical protein
VIRFQCVDKPTRFWCLHSCMPKLEQHARLRIVLVPKRHDEYRGRKSSAPKSQTGYYVRVRFGPQFLPRRLLLLLRRPLFWGGETVVLSGAPSPWRRRAPLGSSSSSSPSSSYAEPDKELALAPVSDPVTGAQHAEEDDDDKTQPQRAASDPENNGHVQTNQAPPARRGRCC